jgi:pimeloyl-ACP methyl ester carboxylesterase
MVFMTSAESGYFDLGDGQIYYEVAGHGDTVVLSHAMFLDSRMFDAQWDALAREYRVVRYDARGYGKSSPLTAPVSRRDDLKRLLDFLGIAKAHLVGCSAGGEASLDLTIEYPQLVTSLTLVGASPSGFQLQGDMPRYMPELFAASQQGDIDRASELQIRIWLDGEYREPAQVDSKLREKALEMNRISVANKTFFVADMHPTNPLTPPAVERLNEVKCPTLIVVGALDHPELRRAAELMRTGIPHAESAVIPEAGHVPSYEQPQIFNPLLLEFLHNQQH